MYDKKSPPDALVTNFSDDKFAKSQVYGRDKARFSLFSSTYDQVIEILLLHYDAQAWAWNLAGHFIAKRGYADYEVMYRSSCSLRTAGSSGRSLTRIYRSSTRSCSLVFFSYLVAFPPFQSNTTKPLFLSKNMGSTKVLSPSSSPIL